MPPTLTWNHDFTARPVEMLQFECSNLACHVAGDHGIFIGKVERYTTAQRAEPPLVFCQGGYTAPRAALAT